MAPSVDHLLTQGRMWEADVLAERSEIQNANFGLFDHVAIESSMPLAQPTNIPQPAILLSTPDDFWGPARPKILEVGPEEVVEANKLMDGS
ncbi:hypothetical protein LTR93_011886 [Exophiala xenobiotica]|nr:hypothetical protein LTR93_011886 [Exophiala xenobiotica]